MHMKLMLMEVVDKDTDGLVISDSSIYEVRDITDGSIYVAMALCTRYPYIPLRDSEGNVNNTSVYAHASRLGRFARGEFDDCGNQISWLAEPWYEPGDFVLVVQVPQFIGPWLNADDPDAPSVAGDNPKLTGDVLVSHVIIGLSPIKAINLDIKSIKGGLVE